MAKPKVVIFNYFVNPKYNFTQNIVDWYNSMKQFYLTDCDRTFVIYTDNSEAKNIIFGNGVHIVDIDPKTTQDIAENIRSKFKYIQKYISEFNPQFDYLAFIQSNGRCLKCVNLSEIIDDNQDLAVCKHIGAFCWDFSTLYQNVDKSIADIQDIDSSEFIYIHACHFISSRHMIFELCKYINDSIEDDRKRKIFTKWQDENYLNFYLNTVLMKRRGIKIKILDGRTYAHTWASWAWRVNKDPSFRIAVEMIDKKQPYANAVTVNQGENGKQKEQMDRKMI